MQAVKNVKLGGMRNFFVVRARHSPCFVRHVCRHSPCFVPTLNLDMYIELTSVSKDFPDMYLPQIVKLAISSQTKVTILFFRVGHEILKDDSREGGGGR